VALQRNFDQIRLGTAVIVIFCMSSANRLAVADEPPLLYWSFDDRQPAEWKYGDKPRELETKEAATGTDCEIEGVASYVAGVSGSAIKFDGFSTYVDGMPTSRSENAQNNSRRQVPIDIPKSITVEAWVALAAYPWNWTPILTTGKYKISGFYFGIDSRGRVGFHVSDGTSVWHECNSKINAQSKLGLELHKWYHVAGTYQPEDGLKVYINGELAATYNDFEFDYGITYKRSDGHFRIGQNREDLPPSDPIRDWATYPSRYSFDGIIDEVKVHRGAIPAKQIAEFYRQNRPDHDPPLAPRPFPVVRPSGRFGANYTRLNYYPEWDALWRPGNDVDVVVQFDQSPTKLIFWRGTRYSPCWVSENNKWMADQSRETTNNWFLSQGSRDDLPTGCIEHMSDTQCRSSRVAIIESNDARCVVNWQYLQMDVRLRQRDIANNTGVGQWGSEYYYVYPDGLCVRHLQPGYGGWQESIVLNSAGTRPEDNVELEACTLVNMDGRSKSYSWENGYPKFDLPGALIQMTNLKSTFKPFIVFREGGRFRVFNVEVRPEYSHFPWWNHWPVAQVISDGRSASAPDRASHSSLSWGDPVGDVALYGMTDQSPESLTGLARSWNSPPEIKVVGGGYDNRGYDYTQRAYIIGCEGREGPLELELAASEKSPIRNLVFVLDRWCSDGVSLTLDKRPVARGDSFRYGAEYDVEGNRRVIVFVRVTSTQPTRIALRRTN
jgi:Concanavalin A-like lectin/glucanases superfamily